MLVWGIVGLEELVDWADRDGNHYISTEREGFVFFQAMGVYLLHPVNVALLWSYGELPLVLVVKARKDGSPEAVFIGGFYVVEALFFPNQPCFEEVVVVLFNILCIELDTEVVGGDRGGGAAATCH